MRDLVFVAVTAGFFAVAALLVAACERIVGPDVDPDGRDIAPVDETAVPA